MVSLHVGDSSQRKNLELCNSLENNTKKRKKREKKRNGLWFFHNTLASSLLSWNALVTQAWLSSFFVVNLQFLFNDLWLSSSRMCFQQYFPVKDNEIFLELLLSALRTSHILNVVSYFAVLFQCFSRTVSYVMNVSL